MTEIDIYDDVLNSWYYHIVWATQLKSLTVT